jgi:hypothetical protein
MRRLTVNDKLTLRRMMAEACEWQDHTNASYIDAAEIAARYEKVLAKIVPLGPLKKNERAKRRLAE